MAIKKTSVNLTDRAQEALEAITEKTGLSQSHVLEALLCQAETVLLVVKWQEIQLPELPSLKAKGAKNKPKP
jgi:hypothetical protein